MSEKFYFCIQSQKGSYVFARDCNDVDEEIQRARLIALDEGQREIWIKRLTSKEVFVSDQIGFLMKEILKQGALSFVSLDFESIPRCEDFFLEIFNDDNGSLICNFYYHKPLKDFLNKYDMHNRFGESKILLPSHIQELELQEIFTINEGRVTPFVGR